MNGESAAREQCSFCLTPRARVRQLVAGPRVSICDACIRRHNPGGLLARLRAWLVGAQRSKGALVRTPYRELPAGCSFCQDAHVPTIAGARARICGTCLDLARDALGGP